MSILSYQWLLPVVELRAGLGADSPRIEARAQRRHPGPMYYQCPEKSEVADFRRDSLG